MEAEGRPNGWS